MAGPPDEPPTRRIDPAAPPPRVRETEVVAEEADPHRLALEDELRSVKRALALVGLISVAALGVALWALLADDEGDNRDARGASTERVSDLEERVNDLERDVEDSATDGSVSELRQEQEQLRERVGSLANQGDGSEEAQQAAEELQGEIQQLEQRVEQVEQQQEQQDSAGGGDTP